MLAESASSITNNMKRTFCTPALILLLAGFRHWAQARSVTLAAPFDWAVSGLRCAPRLALLMQCPAGCLFGCLVGLVHSCLHVVRCLLCLLEFSAFLPGLLNIVVLNRPAQQQTSRGYWCL
jgi:hypothetical protein